MQLGDDDIINLTLHQIEHLLQANRRSLKQFPTIPFPTGYQSTHLRNRLIYEETNYDVQKLKEEFQRCFATLTGNTYQNVIIFFPAKLLLNDAPVFHRHWPTFLPPYPTFDSLIELFSLLHKF